MDLRKVKLHIVRSAELGRQELETSVTCREQWRAILDEAEVHQGL